MTAREWLAAYAERLGVAPPSESETETLLALAGVAAHSSERIAAPLTCWLAARAGLGPEAALALARELAESPADAAPEPPGGADPADGGHAR